METSTNRLDTVWCQLAVIAQRKHCCCDQDIRVYLRRAASEGDSFRTHGLAGLGRHLLSSLRSGEWKRDEALRFRQKVGSVLPRFLYDGFSKVFTDDGKVKVNPESEVAVDLLRQLLVVFSKLPTPYPDKLNDLVLARFKANEERIHSEVHLLEDFANRTFTTPLGAVIKGQSILDDAHVLLCQVIGSCDPRNISPKHGSGASACGTRPWDRYNTFRYCPKIDKIWPYSDFFFSGGNHLCDDLQRLEEAEELPRQAKAVLVPKDYRGPRLISEEPRELMYIQQGLMSLLVERIQRHKRTRGYVNFTDQSINQQLARIGSIYSNRPSCAGSSFVKGSEVSFSVHGETRALATLDLKDASDLLRWDLVKRLFPRDWVCALDACRSTSTVLPNGERIELGKHAPMGSAVCFPIMALTIWALIKAASRRTPCWVYGDDVIVPTETVGLVEQVLAGVGLMVNRDKTFAGEYPFRESCGGEYWGGRDVTPIKLGSLMTSSLDDMVSYIAFVNNVTRKYGPYQNLAMIEYAHQITRCPIIGHAMQLDDDMGPILNEGKSFMDKSKSQKAFVLLGPDHMYRPRYMRRKWNSDLQRWEYLLRVARSVTVNVDTGAWGSVLRFLLSGGDTGFTGRCALARRVRYTTSWTSIA